MDQVPDLDSVPDPTVFVILAFLTHNYVEISLSSKFCASRIFRNLDYQFDLLNLQNLDSAVLVGGKKLLYWFYLCFN